MSRKVGVALGLVVVLAAVALIFGLRSPTNPTSPGDCAMVLGAGPRADCMVSVAVHTFATDPNAGEALLKAEIADPLQRDMVYYRVTKEVTPNDTKYCEKIQEAALKAPCLEWVKRPHLRDGSSSSPRRAPGGPPPGGVPPGGAPPTGSPPAP